MFSKQKGYTCLGVAFSYSENFYSMLIALKE